MGANPLFAAGRVFDQPVRETPQQQDHADFDPNRRDRQRGADRPVSQIFPNDAIEHALEDAVFRLLGKGSPDGRSVIPPVLLHVAETFQHFDVALVHRDVPLVQVSRFEPALQRGRHRLVFLIAVTEHCRLQP